MVEIPKGGKFPNNPVFFCEGFPKGNLFKVKTLNGCMNKTSFPFVLNEVFEEAGGNADGKVSHGVFLQCSGKKLEMKSHQIQKIRCSI